MNVEVKSFYNFDIRTVSITIICELNSREDNLMEIYNNLEGFSLAFFIQTFITHSISHSMWVSHPQTPHSILVTSI